MLTKPSLVSCFLVTTSWLSAVWIIVVNIWSYQVNERSAFGALGWSVALCAEAEAECHPGPTDTGEPVLEGGISLSSRYRTFGGWGLRITHMWRSRGQGFLSVVFHWKALLSLTLSDWYFPYVLEGKGFFFFLLIQGSYWIQTGSSLITKHLTFKVNCPARRHLAHVCMWWVSVEKAACSERAPCLTVPHLPWGKGERRSAKGGKDGPGEAEQVNNI